MSYLIISSTGLIGFIIDIASWIANARMNIGNKPELNKLTCVTNIITVGWSRIDASCRVLVCEHCRMHPP